MKFITDLKQNKKIPTLNLIFIGLFLLSTFLLLGVGIIQLIQGSKLFFQAWYLEFLPISPELSYVLIPLVTVLLVFIKREKFIYAPKKRDLAIIAFLTVSQFAGVGTFIWSQFAESKIIEIVEENFILKPYPGNTWELYRNDKYGFEIRYLSPDFNPGTDYYSDNAFPLEEVERKLAMNFASGNPNVGISVYKTQLTANEWGVRHSGPGIYQKSIRKINGLEILEITRTLRRDEGADQYFDIIKTDGLLIEIIGRVSIFGDGGIYAAREIYLQMLSTFRLLKPEL